MFRPWRSFPTMVASGLIVGFGTGGFRMFSREISEIALAVGMTFSLSEISFRGISARAELRPFLAALGMSYGMLSGVALTFAFLSPDPSLHDGWVLMASVPPAIAVVPITSHLRGDTRRTLVSLAILYVFGLVLVPAITLAFTSLSVPLEDLVAQTILLIGVPLAASRPLRSWPRIAGLRTSAVSISFFFLVTAIAGSTRNPLVAHPELLVPLGLMAFARTFVLGTAVIGVVRALGLPRATRIGLTVFGSFKNLGLTVVLAFAVFGSLATLPSIVSLVFEILWLGALPLIVRTEKSSPSAA